MNKTWFTRKSPLQRLNPTLTTSIQTKPISPLWKTNVEALKTSSLTPNRKKKTKRTTSWKILTFLRAILRRKNSKQGVNSEISSPRRNFKRKGKWSLCRAIRAISPSKVKPKNWKSKSRISLVIAHKLKEKSAKIPERITLISKKPRSTKNSKKITYNKYFIK